jgi:hypothetical protein
MLLLDHITDLEPGLIAAQNKQIVCSALYQWWVNYGAANPSYTGNIYIYESWVLKLI